MVRLRRALYAAFVSKTALVAWLVSAVAMAGSIWLLGPVVGATVGALLSKLTYAPCLLAAAIAALRN